MAPRSSALKRTISYRTAVDLWVRCAAAPACVINGVFEIEMRDGYYFAWGPLEKGRMKCLGIIPGDFVVQVIP